MPQPAVVNYAAEPLSVELRDVHDPEILNPLVQKNVRLQGSFRHNWPIWERVISLLPTGQLDIEPIIGGYWRLDQWKTAFETMHEGGIVKAVLRPQV